MKIVNHGFSFSIILKDIEKLERTRKSLSFLFQLQLKNRKPKFFLFNYINFMHLVTNSSHYFFFSFLFSWIILILICVCDYSDMHKYWLIKINLKLPNFPWSSHFIPPFETLRTTHSLYLHHRNIHKTKNHEHTTTS